MKVIIVNQSKKSEKSMTNGAMQYLIEKKIITFFLKKYVRNKSLLTKKKELTVVFLSSKQMQKINKKFRNINKPTDILSFESHDPSSFGELLLCYEVLKSQALRHRHSISNEIVYMLIHGILHLLGYDHELSKKEEKLMFKLQDACFKALGY